MPRKKVEQEVLEQTAEVLEKNSETEAMDTNIAESEPGIMKDELHAEDAPKAGDADGLKEPVIETNEEPAESTSEDDADNTPERPVTKMKILKIDANEEWDDYDENEVTWHELVVARRMHKPVAVRLAGIERMQIGNVVVAYYKAQRVIIPMTEMMVNLSKDVRYQDKELPERLERICNTMLGAEIDVIIKGLDKATESVVASREEAMLQKRKKFYLTPLEDGLPHVREGRIVEGRIIALTPMVARIEVFGIEITMSATEISWEWISDISQKYHVGEKLPLLITHLEGDNVDNLKIKVDAKSVIQNLPRKNLEKCVVQGKYIGEVSNVRKGVAFINLRNGVNAIAHSNFDKRYPGKGDIVSFVVTRINYEHGNVAGIISRIIKQNI